MTVHHIPIILLACLLLSAVHAEEVSMDTLMSHLGVKIFRTQIVGEAEPHLVSIIRYREGEAESVQSVVWPSEEAEGTVKFPPEPGHPF